MWSYLKRIPSCQDTCCYYPLPFLSSLHYHANTIGMFYYCQQGDAQKKDAQRRCLAEESIKSQGLKISLFCFFKPEGGED